MLLNFIEVALQLILLNIGCSPAELLFNHVFYLTDKSTMALNLLFSNCGGTQSMMLCNMQRYYVKYIFTFLHKV